MASRRVPRATVHPEFLSVEEQLVSQKVQTPSTLTKKYAGLVFKEVPREAPVSNVLWTRSVRGRHRKLNEYPSLQRYRQKSMCTFGVVGHQEGSEVDILEKLGRRQPGPASYNPKRLPSKGGKFNVSNAKSDLEWKMFYAAQTPGPADFDPKPLKSQGGKFSNAVPKSDVEWLIYHAARRPGVGEYDLNKAFKNMTGPGPCTRLSSIERGLYKQSNFAPKKLARTFEGKDIVVAEEEHNRRTQVSAMARGIQEKSPEKIGKKVKKIKDLSLSKSKSDKNVMFVQKVDSRGRVRVGALHVPRFGY